MKQTLTLLSVALLSALMVSSCAKNSGNGAADSTQASANNTDANKAAVRAFYENVMNAHNVNAIDKYCDVAFVDHNPDMGHSGQGLDDMKKSFSEGFAMIPDGHMTIEKMVAEGDMVSTVVTMTGTWKGDMHGMKANGKTCKVTGIDVIRLKDGKAVERWGVFDIMGMMQQLGMMPPPPSAPAGTGKS